MKNFWLLGLGLVVSSSVVAVPTGEDKEEGGDIRAVVESISLVASKEIISILQVIVNGRKQEVQETKKLSLTKAIQSGSTAAEKISGFFNKFHSGLEASGPELTNAKNSLCTEKSSGFSADGIKGLDLGAEEFKPEKIAVKLKMTLTTSDGEESDSQVLYIPCDE